MADVSQNYTPHRLFFNIQEIYTFYSVQVMYTTPSRPLEEWFNLSHDEIVQSPLSFSFYLN